MSYRSNTKMAGRIALCLAFFGIYCFVKVWQNVSIDQMNRKNYHLRNHLEKLRGESALLIVDIENLKRVDRIARIARERLPIM